MVIMFGWLLVAVMLAVLGVGLSMPWSSSVREVVRWGFGFAVLVVLVTGALLFLVGV